MSTTAKPAGSDASAAGPAARHLPLGDGATHPVMLSVIIPSYNARDLLADCLCSIYQNPPSVAFEVIVVDDASGDGTSEMVRARFPEVCLLRNEVNQHYARSNNRALGMVRGQYIHLLNNDAIVLPHALDGMLAFLQTHPEAGAVGCKLLNADGTIQWSVKTLPNPGSALFGARSIITRLCPHNRFSRHHLQHIGRDPSKPFVAGYISSASVMFPRHVVTQVGGLDNRLSYHVDADYCKRVADAGYECYYLPTSTMIHLDHKGGTMVSLRRRFRSLLEFHIGSYIFYRKHLQRSPYEPMHVLVILGLAARFVVAIAARVALEARALAITGVTKRSRDDTVNRHDQAARQHPSRPPSIATVKPTIDC